MIFVVVFHSPNYDDFHFYKTWKCEKCLNDQTTHKIKHFAKEFQQTLNKIQPHCNTYTGIKARIEQVTALNH